MRVGTRIDALLGNRLYDVSFKRALYTGGAQANTQPLQDLNGLRNFLTGTGLFAFFDAPWLPIYLLVMFLFHPLIGVFGVLAALVPRRRCDRQRALHQPAAGGGEPGEHGGHG